jgi:hypothetical protein
MPPPLAAAAVGDALAARLGQADQAAAGFAAGLKTCARRLRTGAASTWVGRRQRAYW